VNERSGRLSSRGEGSERNVIARPITSRGGGKKVFCCGEKVQLEPSTVRRVVLGKLLPYDPEVKKAGHCTLREPLGFTQENTQRRRILKGTRVGEKNKAMYLISKGCCEEIWGRQVDLSFPKGSLQSPLSAEMVQGGDFNVKCRPTQTGYAKAEISTREISSGGSQKKKGYFDVERRKTELNAKVRRKSCQKRTD